MSRTISVAGEGELRDVLAWAIAGRHTLELLAAGTRRGLGRPVAAAHRLDLSRLVGIVDYQPAELVLKARPATPVAEIEALLARHGQRLAFEPPDFGPLYGRPAGAGTLGGALACNLSGPRRPSAFAARDHFLGLRAVSGRAEAFKAGGSVVKNVTGYDVCKLLAGSFGTLAALTEVTVRVHPAAEKTRTLLLLGLDEARGLEALVEAQGGDFDVSGAAHLAPALLARSGLKALRGLGRAATALRLEGVAPSVMARAEALKRAMARFACPLEELRSHDSAVFWRDVRDGLLFDADAVLWRLSLPPAAAAAVVARIRAGGLMPEVSFDWGGGLVVLALPPGGEEAQAAIVRGAIAPGQGHALLLRAAASVRERVAVFPPPDRALLALSRRVKEAFDPLRCLNPGRIHADL